MERKEEVQKFPLRVRIPVWGGIIWLVGWAINSVLSWWSPIEAVASNQVEETPSWFFFRELPAMVCGAPLGAIAVIALLAIGLVWISRR
jgi:hypothetical protein